MLNESITVQVKKSSAHQILDAAVVKVSAVLREAGQQDFDQTLVPGRTHCQKAVLQKHRQESAKSLKKETKS